ncbi:MAG: ATP-binding protein, partial [Tissierellia bacterium]|nr:ATP-binding protein [Tissierellia bacterium]
MALIHLLDNETINKIAAGEVIESPKSIVKELVENSIDAGADEITVEIKNGGKSLIRISDNGKGIEKDQVESAFKRHCTSKISSSDDL